MPKIDSYDPFSLYVSDLYGSIFIIKVCASFKLFLSFSLYNILTIMCNLFYISIQVISKQAWFVIPASFGTFSKRCTESVDQPVH